ncbi:hypothetical protein R20233_01443 [Ralstonia sp. LMG 32965]|uniref:hypothetical protein n=1 Tax=Ralstonia flatus TaxID=3058601 RepID=UPI0028F5045A|nr:hypothetical protein [Ralstonia sp. LMG 32965]CAJ0867777.1 hypothetical protein R20233_01443 [Ralstonia sp. LMG 32965]
MATNIRSRIERLEGRRPLAQAVDFIVISPLGDDSGNGPHLICKMGDPGPFQRVPDHLRLDDPRGLSFVYSESCLGENAAPLNMHADQR